MKPAQFVAMIARANAEHQILRAGRGGAKNSYISAKEIRSIHAGISDGLEELDDGYAKEKGTLRAGTAGLDRVTHLFNAFQNDKRLAPPSRSVIAENCARVISEMSRVGVFINFNVEVGLVLAQRYATSSGHSIRFSEIEPDELKESVADARTGRLAGLTRLVGDAITHSTVHRAERGGYTDKLGEEVSAIPAKDIAHRIGKISLLVEPEQLKKLSPQLG